MHPAVLRMLSKHGFVYGLTAAMASFLIASTALCTSWPASVAQVRIPEEEISKGRGQTIGGQCAII